MESSLSRDGGVTGSQELLMLAWADGLCAASNGCDIEARHSSTWSYMDVP
jgi:hypothetical protein